MALLQRNPDRFLHLIVPTVESNPVILPIFRSAQHARSFKHDVLENTDTRLFRWTLSLCHKTHEACLQTKTSIRTPASQQFAIETVPFHSQTWIAELLEKQIGCLMVDTYSFDSVLTIHGMLWTPHHDSRESLLD